jgi:exopolysaccharide production protein ExoZ
MAASDVFGLGSDALLKRRRLLFFLLEWRQHLSISFTLTRNSMPDKKKNDHIAGIQHVRGIAACLVVFAHLTTILGLPDRFGTDPYGHFLYKGAAGVDLFFVVSGFIITVVTLEKGTLAPRINLFDYAGKRIARILPFLWVCVIVYALLRFLGTGKYDLGPSLATMFLWPWGELRPNVAWTLRHEALFYFIFALSFLGKERRIYLLALWCLSPLLYGLFTFPPTAEQTALQELTAFLFNPSNLTFGCGVLIGMAYLYFPAFQRPGSYPAWSVALMMMASCIALFAVFNEFASAPVTILASVVVLISLRLPASPGRLARLGHLLGDASYSIYLTHGLVLLVAGSAWITLFGKQFYHAALVSLPLAAVLAGVLVHYWVERPLVSLARGALGRIRQSPAPLAEPKTGS